MCRTSVEDNLLNEVCAYCNTSSRSISFAVCLPYSLPVQLVPSQPSTRTRPKLHFYHAKKDCMHNEELEGGSYVSILAGKVMPHRKGGWGGGGDREGRGQGLGGERRG